MIRFLLPELQPLSIPSPWDSFLGIMIGFLLVFNHTFIHFFSTYTYQWTDPDFPRIPGIHQVMVLKAITILFSLALSSLISKDRSHGISLLLEATLSILFFFIFLLHFPFLRQLTFPSLISFQLSACSLALPLEKRFYSTDRCPA